MRLYDKGKHEDAAKYLLQCQDSDDPLVMFRIGCLYDLGLGVEKDLKKAFEWYQKAANQGHAQAEYELAKFYVAGEVVEKSYEKAVQWCRRSADHGLAEAQYLLAVCYEHGYGAVKSIYHAIDYYRMAADQGHKEAKEALERIKKEEKI